MPTTIAILLSCSSFEEFFGDVLSLSVEDYLRQYRNDFSWYFMEMFRDAGLRPILYIPSSRSAGLHRTEDNFEVRFLPIAPYSKKLAKIGIWKGKLGRYITGVVNTHAFLKPLLGAIEADRVDVLYEQEYWHARFDVLTRELRGKVAVVAADHGGVKRENFTLFKQRSLRSATAITVQSAEEGRLVHDYGVEALVIPNPVDTGYYAPSPAESCLKPETQKNLLTVARLTNRQKRTSDLIEAMQYLDQSWRLTIAGDGPDRHMLEDLARERGLQDRIDFLGFVKAKARIRDLYWVSDVFCLPSAMEGLAMVALEAMSSGLPVVLTPAPAFKALVTHGQNGILTPVGEPRELAASIDKAYAHRAEIATAARTTILERYSREWYMKCFSESILARLPRGAATVVRREVQTTGGHER